VTCVTCATCVNCSICVTCVTFVTLMNCVTFVTCVTFATCVICMTCNLCDYTFLQKLLNRRLFLPALDTRGPNLWPSFSIFLIRNRSFSSDAWNKEKLFGKIFLVFWTLYLQAESQVTGNILKIKLNLYPN